MKINTNFLTGVALLTTLGLPAIIQQAYALENPKPNVLILLADDMGRTDMSAFGGEVDTPSIDGLISEGMNFNNFYAAPSCTPSRAMLLSGMDNHRAGVGNMKGRVNGPNYPNQKGKPGYEGILTDDVVSMATRLQDEGYHTYMVGKWHLGEDDINHRPFGRGFEETFSLLEGASSHYNDKTGFVPTQPTTNYSRNGELVGALPEDFYSTDYYTDTMLGFIDKNIDDGKPFLAYMAFTAPHAPLHIPYEELVQKYLPIYQEGWDVVRKRRFNELKRRGFIQGNVQLPPRWDHVKAWDSLTAEEQAFEVRRMAVYAAMIDHLDTRIGDVLQHLKDIGQYDNTLIMFLSDNGADDNDRTVSPAYQQWFKDTCLPEGDPNKKGNVCIDNSNIDKLGQKGTFMIMNEGWAQVSVTPYYAAKATVAEGGIHVPFVAVYKDHILPGTNTNAIASILDVLPTLLDYAGAETPAATYNGQDVFALDGKSMRPVWEGWGKFVHHPTQPIGIELYGDVNKAMRIGSWKILRLGDGVWLDKGLENPEDQPWKLFNIDLDPTELVDLSGLYPEQFEFMKGRYDLYEKRVGFQPAQAVEGVEPNVQNITLPHLKFAIDIDSVQRLPQLPVIVGDTQLTSAETGNLFVDSFRAKTFLIWSANSNGEDVLRAILDGDDAKALAATSIAKPLNAATFKKNFTDLPVVYKGKTYIPSEYSAFFEQGLDLSVFLTIGSRFGYDVIYAFDTQAELSTFVSQPNS